MGTESAVRNRKESDTRVWAVSPGHHVQHVAATLPPRQVLSQKYEDFQCAGVEGPPGVVARDAAGEHGGAYVVGGVAVL